MGSAALDMAYVASGRLDAYIEQSVSLWDIAAGILLVESAGGSVKIETRPTIPTSSRRRHQRTRLMIVATKRPTRLAIKSESHQSSIP
jgi:fructose-1,6-bisphosphatase/inositol monophosphatase family enzyme